MARVKLLWTRSPSLDVVGQQLTVNGVVSLLQPDVAEHLVDVNPGDTLHVELFAYNHFYRSPKAVLDLVVPAVPEAPSELRFEAVQEE